MTKNDKDLNDEKALSTKQLQAAMYLANGLSVSRSARKLGVSRQTMGNWMKIPAFIFERKKAEKMKLTQLAKMYQDSDVSVYKVLITILQDKKAKDSDRIRAAMEINNETRRLRDSLSLEERLSRLEEGVEENSSSASFEPSTSPPD